MKCQESECQEHAKVICSIHKIKFCSSHYTEHCFSCTNIAMRIDIAQELKCEQMSILKKYLYKIKSQIIEAANYLIFSINSSVKSSLDCLELQKKFIIEIIQNGKTELQINKILEMITAEMTCFKCSIEGLVEIQHKLNLEDFMKKINALEKKIEPVELRPENSRGYNKTPIYQDSRHFENKSDKERCISCDSFTILQTRPCGHKSCSNCETKQCVYCVDLNLEVYQTDKNNKLIEFCKLCNTKPAQCIRECKHKCCRDCLKFVCIECPNNILICHSCKKLNDELMEAVCEHKICNNCLNTVCKACFPVYPCSNCGKIKDCYILNCSCKYLCSNCSFLRDGENCYLHSPPLHRCSSHFPCKFTLRGKIIRRECDGKHFCLGCKAVIPKMSDGKWHKKCFKRLN